MWWSLFLGTAQSVPHPRGVDGRSGAPRKVPRAWIGWSCVLARREAKFEGRHDLPASEDDVFVFHGRSDSTIIYIHSKDVAIARLPRPTGHPLFRGQSVGSACGRAVVAHAAPPPARLPRAELFATFRPASDTGSLRTRVRLDKRLQLRTIHATHNSPAMLQALTSAGHGSFPGGPTACSIMMRRRGMHRRW